jgi:hypothetical protein
VRRITDVSGEELRQLEARAKAAGVTAADVLAADELDMPVDTFKAMSSVRTIHDCEAARARLRAQAEAREQAARELQVVEAKRALGRDAA